MSWRSATSGRHHSSTASELDASCEGTKRHTVMKKMLKQFGRHQGRTKIYIDNAACAFTCVKEFATKRCGHITRKTFMAERHTTQKRMTIGLSKHWTSQQNVTRLTSGQNHVRVRVLVHRLACSGVRCHCHVAAVVVHRPRIAVHAVARVWRGFTFGLDFVGYCSIIFFRRSLCYTRV